MICDSCGGDIAKTDKKCKYCGADNPHYVGVVSTHSEPMMEGDSSSESSVPSGSREKISWGLFIVLLIVFWPAAIVYVLVKSVSK